MIWWHRLLRHPDPREGEVCRHFRQGHRAILGGDFIGTYTAEHDYCLDCPTSWHNSDVQPPDPRPGPKKRRNWRWEPV